MAKHAGPRLPAIVECMCPSLNNIYECQRITVTAFFSEVITPWNMLGGRPVFHLFFISLTLIRFSYLCPAVKPSHGDGADVDRCVNEQHDGEDFRPLLYCPHVGCAGAWQYSCGIPWKGTRHTSPYAASCLWGPWDTQFISFPFLFSPASPTRWINMPRSCLQPWVQAWRRKTIQVGWQKSNFLCGKKLTYSSLAVLIY